MGFLDNFRRQPQVEAAAPARITAQVNPAIYDCHILMVGELTDLVAGTIMRILSTDLTLFQFQQFVNAAILFVILLRRFL